MKNQNKLAIGLGVSLVGLLLYKNFVKSGFTQTDQINQIGNGIKIGDTVKANSEFTPLFHERYSDSNYLLDGNSTIIRRYNKQTIGVIVGIKRTNYAGGRIVYLIQTPTEKGMLFQGTVTKI